MSSILHRDLGTISCPAVSAAELARLFGVTRETVSGWITQGLPHEPRDGPGKEHAIKPGVAVTWLVRRELAAADSPRAALDRAKAEALHLELERRRGELVPVSEVAPTFEAFVQHVRSGLLQLPDRLAHALLTVLDREREAAAFDIARDCVDEILRELAGSQFSTDGTDAPE